MYHALKGTPRLGQLPVLATQAGGLVGTVIGAIFPGGHYTGPVFVPNGVVAWAQAGHWDYIQQVLTTGHGPHWSQPDSHPNGTNYDLNSAGDVGAYGSIPGNIPLRQWLTQFLATYGPHPVTNPVTMAPSYLPTQGLTPTGAAPTPTPTTAAGLPMVLGIGIAAAALVAFLKGPKRRRNRRRFNPVSRRRHSSRRRRRH